MVHSHAWHKGLHLRKIHARQRAQKREKSCESVATPVAKEVTKPVANFVRWQWCGLDVYGSKGLFELEKAVTESTTGGVGGVESQPEHYFQLRCTAVTTKLNRSYCSKKV